MPRTLTKPQQIALRALFRRAPIYREVYAGLMRPITYRQFRETVQFSSDCAMVFWCSMWLGIEEDGYVHS